MSETQSPPAPQGPSTAEQPSITHDYIENVGLTMLATGGLDPALDVFFVHGLQGHPENTWTYVEKESAGKEARTSRLGIWNFRKKKASEPASSTPNAEADKLGKVDTYWPTDLLAYNMPTARIYTYGYDSSVCHFFNGPANKNTITENGRDLLNSIVSQRRDCRGRPLMLIVHSLGGIVVKSALRRAFRAEEIDDDLKEVYDSTFAILFFGTPHRGSDWADAGLAAKKIIDALGFSTSGYNLHALEGNTEILEILRDDFSKMLDKRKFHITSFQESTGAWGAKSLDAKIVEPDSSGLDHTHERKIPINANHMNMCRFSKTGPTRKAYDQKVWAEIDRHWKRLQELHDS